MFDIPFSEAARQMLTACIGAGTLAFLALLFGDFIGEVIRFRMR